MTSTAQEAGDYDRQWNLVIDALEASKDNPLRRELQLESFYERASRGLLRRSMCQQCQATLDCVMECERTGKIPKRRT